MIGLIIREDGRFDIKNFDNFDDFNDLIINFEDYKLLEIHKLENNNEFHIYATTIGTNFNNFDLLSANAIGDILILKLNIRLNHFINIDMEEFLEYYNDGTNLDDYLIEDELEITEDYDFEDGFLVREEDGYLFDVDDLDSYIEYFNQHK